jgi:hypothetical protein
MTMESPIVKFATVAAIAVAALIAIEQFDNSMDRAAPAYADMPASGRRHGTLTCKVSFRAPGETAKVTALEPFYVRIERSTGKGWLLDRRQRKLILVDSAKKTAKIIRAIKSQPKDLYQTLSDFRIACRRSAEQIGQRRIGQKQTMGFHLAREGRYDETIVWLDAQTQMPVRIELLGTNRWGQKEPEIVYSDIVFDVDLDESLFELDLAGYDVEEAVGVPAAGDLFR